MNKDWGEMDHNLPPKSWPNSSWRCDTQFSITHFIIIINKLYVNVAC